MKKLISVVLSVVMLLSVASGMTFSASAEEIQVPPEISLNKTYTEGFSKDDSFESNYYWDHFVFSVPENGKFTLSVSAKDSAYYVSPKAMVVITSLENSDNMWMYDKNGTIPKKASDSIEKGDYLLTFAYSDTSLKGDFTFKIEFAPNVKKTSLTKLIKGKKSFVAKWKKASGVTGYEIQYSTDKKFKKNVKVKTVKKAKTTKLSVKKLKSGKKYYVRIRSYKTIKISGKNKKYYSKWSAAKTVKVK